MSNFPCKRVMAGCGRGPTVPPPTLSSNAPRWDCALCLFNTIMKPGMGRTHSNKQWIGHYILFFTDTY